MNGIIDKIVSGLLEGLGSPYLVTFIISMIPMIEVRGAIPIAIKMGMNPWSSYFFSCVSALLVCPALILCLRPLLNALKKTKMFKGLARAVEDKFKLQAKKIEDKALDKTENDARKRKLELYKMLGLFVFVAIPLPMTGVWTATMIAVFINMDIKRSILSIAAGNFVAGALITVMTVILGDKSWIILVVLAGFVVITVAGLIIKLLTDKKKNKTVAAEKPAAPLVYTDKDSEQ